jgi:beta-mannosidase
VSIAKFLLPLLLLPLTFGNSQAQGRAGKNATRVIKLAMHDGWQFHEVGKSEWYPATVPGCVHTDLLSNKLIDDPFYRDNEQKLQWIGKTDWEYQTTFKVAPELLGRDRVELVFEGLDTYADVSLNEVSLFSADNMFRNWRVDCKALLKVGTNTLHIRFRSPINEVLPVMAKLSYQLPASNDQGEKTSPYTRKAPYQYGWDWGPRFVTSGIWRPVLLEAWDRARVNDLHILPKAITTEAANLTAEVEVFAEENISARVAIDNLTDKQLAGSKEVNLVKGSNLVKLDFVIRRPALWWPSGLGAQPLYSFQARLLSAGQVLDQTITRTGLRTIKLQQQPDDSGKSFTFTINGVLLFAKGGNWIPADSFPTRISQEKYRRLLESVRDTNMNMLRVWGGGIYESDEFYELCDELGILVWQDFMFACSMYPGDQGFLDNVRQEAIDNVKRLRNHPSIAIWVGNNEIETAWKHWGWKDQLPATLWDDYLKIFHGVLPEVCAALDPSRPYWPSSPSSNLEQDSDSQKVGDVHYWQVWHAASPFNEYEKQFPRFMSEYGFQSFPQLETVSTYTLPEDRDIKSPVMMAHQRHPRGNQLIREYMLREYPEPKDFASFLYVSQVLQAEGIKIGAEHLRRIMPHNMGSLFWQIDDCWPVASWSSIDYTGRWKALQYYARRFYADLLLSPHEEGGNLNFYVVSDRRLKAKGELKVNLFDFQGRRLWSDQREVEVFAQHSKSYLTVPIATLLADKDPTTVFVAAELVVDGKVVATAEHFFQPFRNLSLPQPQISAEVLRTRAGFRITLASDKLARAVYLSAPDETGVFVDNYFDLIPGRKVEVEYRTERNFPLSEFRKALKVRSLADAF